MDEPDFELRLAAFKHLAELTADSDSALASAESLGVPLIAHQCTYMLAKVRKNYRWLELEDY